MIPLKKHLWLLIAILTLAAVSGIWIWASSRQGPEQIITLPNGSKFRFVGVTYSKENVPPSIVAKVLRRLPASWAAKARLRLGNPDSQHYIGEKWDHPQLVFWFRRSTTNSTLALPPAQRQQPSIPSAVLADEAGVVAGAQVYPILQDDVVWSFVSFPLVPRRSKTIECRFSEGPFPLGAQQFLGTVKIPNPLFGRFSAWQPEPLSAVKKAGDLEVRLDEVAFGSPRSGASVLRPNGTRASPLTPVSVGERIQTQFDLFVRTARGANEDWVLQSSELSDATGNILADQSQGAWIGAQYAQRPQADWHGMSGDLSGALWPNEPAWRLKMAFKRSFGFDSNEVVTFANVPIPAMGITNTNSIVQMAGNQKLVLRNFERHGDIKSNLMITFLERHWLTELSVELPGKPADLVFDVWDVKTDAGEAVQYGHSNLTNSYVLCFRSVPTNATKMDLTFILQKTRSVEFTLKPPKPGD